MDAEPLVNVVRGNPSEEELAALLAVLTSTFMTTDSHSPPAATPTPWTRSARPASAARDWRTSGLPR
jgi:hypothetical protein